MFRYIPGKCRDIPWYIFRDIPPYSVIFSYIPWYSGIPGFHNARRARHVNKDFLNIYVRNAYTFENNTDCLAAS
jgi:hypothetical protein